MTKSPIERAARAMYDTVDPEWEWDDPEAELLRRMYRENAKAAILALKEPSEVMVDAGADVVRNVNTAESDFAVRDDTKSVWNMMIDAALGEE
jgi:hypothetical protein